MGIDESGQEHMARPVDADGGGVGVQRKRPGKNGQNPSVPDHHGMIFQYDPGGLDRNYPAGGDYGVGRVHAGSLARG
jgi:hypothetical protein